MITKKLPILFFVMCLTLQNIYSQIVTGRVVDADGKKPIENVNIYNKRSNDGTITNTSGFFSLQKRTRDADTLIFSHVGYQTRSIIFADLKAQKNEIKLVQSRDELGSIDINTKKLNSKIEFEKLSDMPQGLYGFSANIVNDDLYIIGGSKSIETNEFEKLKQKYPERDLEFLLKLLAQNPNRDFSAYSSKIYKYNFSNKIWSTIEKSIIPRADHNSDVIDNKIYIHGGKSLSTNRRNENLPNKIEIYNPMLDTLIVDKTNPHLAVNFASFSRDSLLFVFGGSTKIHRATNKKEFSNKVHVFNINNGFWLELNSMPEPKETSGILTDHIFYFIGGDDGKELNFIETYNLKNGKWQRIGKLFDPIRKPALAKNDNVIYILGENRISTLNTLTLNLKEYRIDLNIHQPKLVLYQNNLYIMGGYTETQFEQKPSHGFYKVSLDTFDETKVLRKKILNNTRLN